MGAGDCERLRLHRRSTPRLFFVAVAQHMIPIEGVVVRQTSADEHVIACNTDCKDVSMNASGYGSVTTSSLDYHMANNKRILNWKAWSDNDLFSTAHQDNKTALDRSSKITSRANLSSLIFVIDPAISQSTRCLPSNAVSPGIYI